MRQLIRLISFSIACSLIGGCDRGAAKRQEQSRPPAAVTVARAVAQDVPLYLDEIGRATASETVIVRPQISGRVTEVRFKDGADLKKGDLLFVIDPRPFQAALAQSEAAVIEAGAQVDMHRRDLDRMAGLTDTNAVSKQDYDNKRAMVDVSLAKQKAAESAVEVAQLNLEYCTIKAPIDGRAGARRVDPGNIVKENDDVLLTIERLDPVYIDFSIPENQLPVVRHHMAAGTLKVQATVPGTIAAPTTQPVGPERTGDVTMLDNTVQQSAGTIRLRATLFNSDHYFWPGQFVNVRLVLSVRKDAILVPARAVQIGQVGSFVYVAKDDSTAELRPVVLGQRQGEMVVVENGVSSDESVIVTGQMMLYPGAPVTIVNAPAAASEPHKG